MVYCGKPSKSCRQCRNRNIKCDKKTPSCGQCVRAHLQCPGYHNPNHLTFRDETQTTILKSIEREELLLLLPPPLPPVFDRAKQHFVNRYALKPSSRLGFLMRWRPPTPCDAYFSASIKAVMFACLFHEVKCISVLQQARKSYSSALVLLNRSLQSPETVTKDVTIATVLILDLFEKFTAREGFDKGAAKNHLQGATAIFTQRGGKQFADPNTMSMFRYLSLDLILNCLNRCARIPGDFLHLHNQAGEYVKTNDYEWQFMDLMIRLAQLKAALQDGSISVDDVTLALRELDYDYFRILHGSPEYSYVDTSEHNSPPITPGRYENICPGIGPLETRHTVLVRNWLDELHQQNILNDDDIPTQ